MTFKDLIYEDIKQPSKHFHLCIEDSHGRYHVFDTPPTQAYFKVIQQLLQKGFVVKYSKFPTEYGFGQALPKHLSDAYRICFSKQDSGEMNYELVDVDGYCIQEFNPEEAYNFCKNYNLPVKQLMAKK